MTHMLRKTIPLALIGGALLLTLAVFKWAQNTRKSRFSDNPPVARVYKAYLYKSDLDHLYADKSSAEDKAKMAEHYIQSWVSKQLLIAEAEAHSGYNKAEVERKLLDYRNDLLVHDFVEKLVNAQVSREVSDEEIKSYYKAHRKDFVLRSSLFKGKFVIVPKDVPQKAELNALLVGKSEKQRAALKRYCLKFARDYSLDENVWLPWEKLIKDTSLNSSKNKNTLLRTRKLIQTSDSTQRYYFKISAYKLAGDVSPLAFVRSQIIERILHKRKIELAGSIKKDLLQRAKKSNNCVIYEH